MNTVTKNKHLRWHMFSFLLVICRGSGVADSNVNWEVSAAPFYEERFRILSRGSGACHCLAVWLTANCLHPSYSCLPLFYLPLSFSVDSSSPADCSQHQAFQGVKVICKTFWTLWRMDIKVIMFICLICGLATCRLFCNKKSLLSRRLFKLVPESNTPTANCWESQLPSQQSVPFKEPLWSPLVILTSQVNLSM